MPLKTDPKRNRCQRCQERLWCCIRVDLTGSLKLCFLRWCVTYDKNKSTTLPVFNAPKDAISAEL